MAAPKKTARSKSKRPRRLPSSACSAVVTRYPTGCFGIAYRGSQFYWWGFGETTVRNKLAELNIPAESVRWQERYYDGDYRDPANYKTRRFFPQNVKGDSQCPDQ